MTELEKSKEIIQFIANAEKTTPVELYTDEEIVNSYACKVIGKNGLKVVFGNWEEIEKIISENNAQDLEEPKKEDVKQEEIKKEEVKTEELKKEEPKKEEVKKLNRKYSEEVIRKSLGLGVKLKSKTK